MSSNGLVGIATQVMVMAILSTVLILVIGIGILVLMRACTVGCAFCQGLRTMSRSIDSNCSMNKNNRLSPEEMEKLPSFDFSLGQDFASISQDCAVCLENFQVGDKCRMLPLCKHLFHKHCVDSWLAKSAICPICRSSVNQHVVIEFPMPVNSDDQGDS